MEKTLSFQLTGEIAKKFEKEKGEFEAKMGCKVSWTQFFSYREKKMVKP
jgi:hypothetical protein